MVLLVFLFFGPLLAEGDELIGKRAPGWQVSNWIHSGPLELEDLRGKVVLVRWWTAPECPFCAASAPALNELHKRYDDRGLVVIGFYHHKSSAPLDPEKVEGYVARLGFRFPVAIDEDWKTLRRWWLDGHRRRWTSVTFLIDREGVIRYIHPGGAYEKDTPDHRLLESTVRTLLQGPAAR